MNQRNKKNLDTTGMISCALCGLKANCLASHLVRMHKITCEEYTQKYNLPTRSEKYLKGCAARIKGDKNPGYQHGGKFSSLSDNFIHADKINKKEVVEKIRNSMKTSGKCSTTLKYWLDLGFSEEQAKEKLSERQTTFSKEICIEKYGEVEGLEKWKARQEKWQKTLNSKSPDEIERINRAKLGGTKGYSKVSQKLFKSLVEHLNGKKVYFATNNNNLLRENQEFFYISPDNHKFFLDFYCPESKKVIEFDGDYWHGEKRGNQERDRERDRILQENGFKIFRVAERDYKKDPNKVINDCLEFLNG